MMLRIFFILLSLAFVPAANSGQLEDGLVAYDRGDSAAAIVLLQPLAEQGDADALFWVGEMHYQGVGGMNKNYYTALLWLRKAADKKHGGALRRLGLMYERGYGVAKDEIEAKRLYELALPLVRAAAGRGDHHAQSWLGIMYDIGSGLLKDEVEAEKWYRKAANQGNALAQNNLGLMYADGLGGLPKDEAEAARWYLRAAGQGFVPACYSLGELYGKSRGELKDEAEAVKWYRKAAEQGHADAQYTLGWMYANGIGVVEDQANALKWYLRAAGQGSVEACYNVARLYQRGYGSGVRWYRKVAEQDNSTGHMRVRWRYETGFGIAKDEAEALKWYTKAAEQGHASSQYAIAVMYRDGVGAEKDDMQAYKWFLKAAATGHVDAQSSLANMHRLGIGTPANSGEAGRIYREIIQKSGNSAKIREAIIAIGFIEGRGVAIDLLKDIDLEVSDFIRAVSDLWDAGLDEAQVAILMNILDEIIKFDTGKEYRAQIIRTLADFRDRRVTEPLLRLARDRDSEARLSRSHIPENAGYALRQLGNVNAMEPLIAALKDPDKQIRLIAAAALRRHHDKSATIHLVDALQDTDEDVRFAVIEALGNRGDKSAIPALSTLLHDESEPVRTLASAALEKLKTPPPPLPEEKPKTIEWQCKTPAANNSKPVISRDSSGTEPEGTTLQGGKAGHPALEVQIGSAVLAAVLSADGTLLLDGTSDGVARLWEVSSGRQIRRFIGHTGKINAVAFSPDGVLIATASQDNSIRLWDFRTGVMLYRPLPQNSVHGGVSSITFTGDGRYLITEDGIWEVATGRFVSHVTGASAAFPDGSKVAVIERTLGGVAILNIHDGSLIGHAEHPEAKQVVVSPDGNRILTIGERDIRMFSDAGQELWKTSYNEEITSAAFTSDSQRMIAGGKGWLRVTDRSGRIIREILDPAIDAHDLHPSADGTLLLVRSYFGYSAMLINLPDGKILRTYRGQPVLSPDGTLLTNWENGAGLSVERTRSGQPVQTFHWIDNDLRSAAWAPDGNSLAVVDLHKATLWNLVDGVQGAILSGQAGLLTSLAYSPDSRIISTINWDAGRNNHIVGLWDAATGRQLSSMAAEGNAASLEFSQDGRAILTGQASRATLRDAATGRELQRFEMGGMWKASFASGGKSVVATVSPNNSSEYPDAVLFDVATGTPIKKFSSPTARIENFTLSPNGNYLAAATFQSSTNGNFERQVTWPVILFDLATCREIRRFKGNSGSEDATYNVVRFSPDGRRIFASVDTPVEPARIWDVESGQEVARLAGRSELIVSAVFSPDGRFIATAGKDATVRLWNASDGREMASLISLDKGRWIVTTPDGRFDTNSLEDLPEVSWVMSDDPLKPLPIEVFMKEYYEPGLLARILNNGSFRPVRDLQTLNRVQPDVSVTAIQREKSRDLVSVTIEVAGGKRIIGNKEFTTAVQDLKLFRDGQLVKFQEGRLPLDQNGKAVVTFKNIRLPRKADTREVEFSAYAFNDDGIKSPTSSSTFAMPAGISPAKGKVYLVNIGVNRYQNAAWNLQYAAGDALKIRQTLESRIPRAAAYSDIISITLTDENATKVSIKAVFDLLSGAPVSTELKQRIPDVDRLAKAAPEDLLIISFSGHGHVDDNGIFYTFSHDTGPASNREVTAELLSHIISSDELSRWLRYVDAGDMAMIVDACHSAATVGDGFKPGPMGSRGLGQLAYDKGMKILAASQADDVALESDKLQQGLLTYSLVHDGLDAFQADYKPTDKSVTLSELLSYAVDRVPRLYEEVKSGNLSTFGRGEESRAAVIQLGDPKKSSLRKKNPYQTPALFDFTRKQKGDVAVAGQ